MLRGVMVKAVLSVEGFGRCVGLSTGEVLSPPLPPQALSSTAVRPERISFFVHKTSSGWGEKMSINGIAAVYRVLPWHTIALPARVPASIRYPGCGARQR